MTHYFDWSDFYAGATYNSKNTEITPYVLNVTFLFVSSMLPEERPSLSQLLPPSLGYVPTHLRKPPTCDEPEVTPVGLRHARLQSTPSSCYSDWDSSLWSTWSSAMDGNINSTRTSLISSVDSCYTDNTNFSRWLTAATAAESVSGASLSGKHVQDLSPTITTFFFSPLHFYQILLAMFFSAFTNATFSNCPIAN